MRLFLMVLILALSGCNAPQLSVLGNVPRSLGEQNSGFTYVPLDPLTVNYPGCTGESNGYDVILDQLPDNAVRIATKKLSTSSESSFGPIGLGVAGEKFKIVLDYVNVDNSNIPFQVKIIDDWVEDRVSGERKPKRRYEIQRLAQKRTYQSELATSEFDLDASASGIYVVPVYVGVGLRLTAEIEVIKGTVNLSSLPGIAASVEAGNASGSLVVQTLGITGKQTSTGLIITSDLNETTVQNAILSLGKIKAILYSNDAIIRPRVTGMYLPLPDGTDELVNLIVSELARESIPWDHQQC